jgi:hypothetical protein
MTFSRQPTLMKPSSIPCEFYELVLSLGCASSSSLPRCVRLKLTCGCVVLLHRDLYATYVVEGLRR